MMVSLSLAAVRGWTVLDGDGKVCWLPSSLGALSWTEFVCLGVDFISVMRREKGSFCVLGLKTGHFLFFLFADDTSSLTSSSSSSFDWLGHGLINQLIDSLFLHLLYYFLSFFLCLLITDVLCFDDLMPFLLVFIFILSLVLFLSDFDCICFFIHFLLFSQPVPHLVSSIVSHSDH